MGPRLPPPKNDGKAVASLVLGVASVTLLLGAIAGIPAIVLGSIARRDIDRSGGRLAGSALAAVGIMSGLFGTGLGLVVAAFLVSGAVELVKDEQAAAIPIQVTAGTRSYGSLEVVDLDDREPLHDQLAAITERARGRIIVLQTFARTSPECARIASSLSDRRMQRALANVTLVRVDVERFGPELREMRVETDSHPWFYKLDVDGEPLFGISRASWEESVPEKMAPVLARFVRTTR